MTGINLAIKITGDTRSGIDAFRALKFRVDAPRNKLNQTTENVKSLVQAANVGKLKMLAEAQRQLE